MSCWRRCYGLILVSAIVSSLTAVSATVASAQAAMQFVQRGTKLLGVDAVGASPEEGGSVAASADGNTVVVGGPTDNNQVGAAWVFTRSGGVWTQEAPKLVGTGAGANAQQGTSVAVSADGNTVIVGGPGDNNMGAAWVFIRLGGGTWIQQGPKLVGSGAAGFPVQGFSVALSADGNTAIIGGPGDNSQAGAAWVFTRSGGTWTQQGAKLFGTGAVGNANQGYSVALSADGNTAVIGGWADNGLAGAAWVFTRSGGIWTQQGSKLFGTGADGNAFQGYSVALSGDGNTALLGGQPDNNHVGAAWVFTRSGGTWTQQGSKLVGSGAIGGALQGYSVALSGDGDTALIGGIADNGGVGAAWVFIRSGGAWTQLGSKLVGGDAVGAAQQGYAVALSGDGQTAVLGGITDNNTIGAAWVFVRVPKTVNSHDLNGDGKSDIVWRDGSGTTAAWLMNGGTVSSSGAFGIPTTWSLVAQRDFDGDGKVDWLWRDNLGNTAIWFMNGAQVASTASLGNVPTVWSVAGTADFNGDGKGDILWRDSAGNLAIYLMKGGQVVQFFGYGAVPLSWQVAATADFDGDGKADVLWRDTSGSVAVWFMDGTRLHSSAGIGLVPPVWSILGTGDLDGDGKADIVWRDSGGNVALWLMNGASATSSGGLGTVPAAWSLPLTGDFDGDGKSDLLWNHSSGATSLWFMNGLAIASTGYLGTVAGWAVQGTNAE